MSAVCLKPAKSKAVYSGQHIQLAMEAVYWPKEAILPETTWKRHELWRDLIFQSTELFVVSVALTEFTFLWHDHDRNVRSGAKENSWHMLTCVRMHVFCHFCGIVREYYYPAEFMGKIIPLQNKSKSPSDCFHALMCHVSGICMTKMSKRCGTLNFTVVFIQLVANVLAHYLLSADDSCKCIQACILSWNNGRKNII